MTDIAEVRRDGSGAPVCSLTFLLSRTPAPHERISDLVISATLALEIACHLDDLAHVELRLETAEPVSAAGSGPFGTVALGATVEGEEARGLLAAVAARSGGPDLAILARRADGVTGAWRRNLVDLLGPVLDGSPERVVRLVAVDGGEVRDVLPVRSARTRGPGREPMMLRHEVAVPLTQVVRPRPSAVRPHLSIRPHLADDLVLEATVAPILDGPVLTGEPLLRDRRDDDRWFIPELELVMPDPGQEPGESPFRFDIEQVGHQADGSPALEATIVVTFSAGASRATLDAWEAAGRPTLKPVRCVPQVALVIPFRDNGTDRTERMTANSFNVTKFLGEDGSKLTATFVLQNDWVRLAYGALSTPGFQTQPAALEVGLVHHGWRVQSGSGRLAAEKVVAPKILALRRRDDVTKRLARTQLLGMAKAEVAISPAVAFAKLDLTRLTADHVRTSATAVSRHTALVACADHPELYRQAAAGGGWESVGCRPALKLGETEYRPWQPETVSTPGVKVFRSLTQPGRFMVIPEKYAVGRYPGDDPERAYEPTLLLTSTIDVENPANIRCVLAAALEPETDAADLDLLAGELRRRLGREVELVGPWQAGVAPDVSWAVPGSDSVECVAIDTGFTFLLTTDIPGLLTLRNLLQHGGLVGSARYAIPGGDTAVSTLRLDLSRVVGPPEGPVDTARSGDTLTLTNRLARRVSVDRIAAAGQVVATPSLLIDPGGEATLTLPAGTPDPVALGHSVEPGTETLDETRSYIEDLSLGVTFVATGNLSGLAGLEVRATFLGADAEPLTLTESDRQGERGFVLPLTTYAADPAVTFTVTAVADDGTRTTSAPVEWPVRSRGVLIPISTPTPQP